MSKRIFPYLAVIIFFVIAIFVDFNHHPWTSKDVLRYDRFGYHNYLPALFIYSDLTKYSFIDSIEQQYPSTNGEQKRYGLHPVEKTGNLCNQYPIGVAVFQAPLFLVAHLWATVSGRDKPDGYSAAYQHSVVLSTLLFATLGLLILSRFLRKYFSDVVVFFTTLLIAFSTNFFHYATLESGMAHIYQFFLYSSILYLTYQWYRQPAFKTSTLIGICIGLAIITRPTDLLICIIPLSWASTMPGKWDFIRQNMKYVWLIVFFTFLFCLPQILYWKYVTGDWVYYSYNGGDYFRFDRLRIIQGLFSYRKGWFVYTPLALLAFIYMWSLRKESSFYSYKKTFWIFFIPMIYLVFSWNNWFYGWSYGCRALLGTLPLLAIPLALMVQDIATSKLLRKLIAVTGVIFITFLNLFQTWQYKHYILHGALMNESTYWALFLKTEKPSDFDKNFKLQEELDWNTGGF